MLRKFLKAGFWVIGSNLSAKLINFVTLNFLAKMLNPASFGVYSAFISSAASINQISDVGTTIVLQRTGARIDELGPVRAIQRFYIILLIQGIINLAFVGFIYLYPELISKIILNSTNVNDSLNLVGIVAVLQVFAQLPLTFLLGLGEFRKYAYRTFIYNMVTLFTTICLLLGLKADLHMAIIAIIVSLTLNLVFIWMTMGRLLSKYKARFPTTSATGIMKGVIKEGFIYYLGNVLAGAIMNFVLISLFARHIGIAELGYIRIASALIAIIGIIPTALQTVTITFLSRDTPDVQELKSIQLRYVTLLSFFASVLLLFFLDLIIKILFGSEYLPGKSIYIFMILTNIMIMVSSVVTNFLVSKGHTNYVGMVSTVGVVLYTIISVIAIPVLGIYGFFLGHIVGYGVGFIFVLNKEFRSYKYTDLAKLKQLGFIVMLGIAGLIPAYLMVEDGWNYLYRFFYLILMTMLVSVVAINERDKERIGKMWQSIKSK